MEALEIGKADLRVICVISAVFGAAQSCTMDDYSIL
jgi:hypothetical protein